MKKSKRPVTKPSQFSNRPLAPLKGIQTGPAKTKPRVAPAPTAGPDVTDDEATLFLRAVADVRLIPKDGETVSPVPLPKRIEEEERRAFLQAVESLQLDVKFEDELPEDVAPLRPLPVNRLRQLRRGAIRIELELDLHGLTRDEAIENLAHFIAGAHRRGQRAVLVITGKGNNSPEEPVLQGVVAGWLRDKGRGMVAEFAPAPRNLGGSGAYVVFLKEKEPALGTRDSGLETKNS